MHRATNHLCKVTTNTVPTQPKLRDGSFHKTQYNMYDPVYQSHPSVTTKTINDARHRATKSVCWKTRSAGRPLHNLAKTDNSITCFAYGPLPAPRPLHNLAKAATTDTWYTTMLQRQQQTSMTRNSMTTTRFDYGFTPA